MFHVVLTPLLPIAKAKFADIATGARPEQPMPEPEGLRNRRHPTFRRIELQRFAHFTLTDPYFLQSTSPNLVPWDRYLPDIGLLVVSFTDFQNVSTYAVNKDYDPIFQFQSAGSAENTTTMLGNGADFFASPNLSRPLMKRISFACGNTIS